VQRRHIRETYRRRGRWQSPDGVLAGMTWLVLDELQQPQALRRSLFRTLILGRPRTPAYSSRMGGVTYRRAGFVMARSRVVRCSPSGLSAADTTMLVSRTRRSGSIYRFFFFSVRYSLTIWSIWRGVSLLVPLRFDSSPMTRSTSGSGAASFT
jgi:hypothetical protein